MKKALSVIVLACVLLLAGCSSNAYDVVVHMDNIPVTGDSVASVTEDFCITLEAEELHLLPRTVEVTVDGMLLAEEDYSYDPDTGKLRIPADLITGAVEISAEAERISYPVALDADSLLTIEGDLPAYPQQKYKATLVAPQHYLLPESVSILVSGQLLEEGDYSYDASTGKLVINAEITGEVIIAAQAEPVSYEVDISAVTGAVLSCEEEQQAMPAFGYTATLISAEGYALPESVEILVDGTALDAASYTYDASTGELAIPGEAITGKLEIRAAGVALIVGDWTATVNATPLVQQYVKSSEPSMAPYMDFHGLYVDIELHLGTDSKGSVTVDPNSLSAMMDKVQGQVAEGIQDMLQDVLAEQGLNFSVETYLALAGINLKSLVKEYVNLDSINISLLDFQSLYRVEGNKIFLFEKKFNPDGEDYIVYSLEEERLVISSVHGDVPIPGYMLPISLDRAAQ